MAGSKASAPPSPITPTPKAAVFDTSLWGKGTLDVGRLTAHAKRLAKSGIEVWVPEQVLLEWASHVVDDAKEATPAWGRLKRAGLVEYEFPVSTVTDTIVTAVTKTVSAIDNVTILPMLGDSAVAGIKDQILGTGPGEKRGGTKTGAVDSSWVRDALMAAGGDVTRIVVVTGNAKDVFATAKATGVVSLNVRSEHDLFASLFTLTQAPKSVTNLVATYLLALVPSSGEFYDPHSAPIEAWIDINDFSLTSSAFDPLDNFEVNEVTLDPEPLLVGLRNVEVVDPSAESGDKFQATIEFDVVLLGNLTVLGYELDNDGAVQMRSAGIHNAIITAPFVADVEDLLLTNVNSQGPATVESAEARFADPADARQWLAEELSSYAGINLGSEEGFSDKETFLTGFDDRKVTVTASGGVFEEWSLDFDMYGGPVSIVCRFDPGARVWDGRESFDMFLPYYVSSDEGEFAPEPYSSIAAVWRFLIGV